MELDEILLEFYARPDDCIYLDTETCGLHGMAVLLQFAVGEGEIHLYSLWKHQVKDTLLLLEKIINHPGGICGFNLAFDFFHLAKIYTTFTLFAQRYGYEEYPDEHVDEIGVLEAEARDGPCIKPFKSLDLMLHARKGPFQSLMNRDDIRIKRVPTALAWELAKELQQRIPLNDIYFARNKDGKGVERFRVYDVHDEDGNMITEFKDIVCKFSPSTALKALAVHALGVKEDAVLKFADIECTIYPTEYGYAPFALAVGKPGAWQNAWPEVIRHHIRHWSYNDLARVYARNDIVYTRGLRKYFDSEKFRQAERPVMNDDDSILACLVAVVRWRGMKVNLEGIQKLKDEAIDVSKSCVIDGNKVKIYLKEVMNETEYLTIQESTKKVILEEVSEWKCDDNVTDHPAAIRAKEVLAARRAKKEVELYDKLLLAGRFHCSFVVIGTKSSRMSGTDGLNPQGINHTKKVRSQFPFAWDTGTWGSDPLILCGGDFSSFEVSLAAAVYKDPLLDEDLKTFKWIKKDKNGKEAKKIMEDAKAEWRDAGEGFIEVKQGTKMAGLFGEAFFPDLKYEDILESEGSDDEDFYDLSKRGMYAYFYGGNEATLENRLGISKDIGKAAMDMLAQRYKGIGVARTRIENMFCSMRQPGGIGTKVEWHEPSDYIESPLGFRRYFTLENMICKALFELANKPPKGWSELKFKVVRRDRLQTCGGATQSALYAAAFAIQAANLRAAANHEIQCFGSQITKAVEVEVWSFQPCGIHKWHVMPFNCHDEIDAPCLPELQEPIKKKVLAKIETYRHLVPMIKMKWDIGMSSWKGKE